MASFCRTLVERNSDLVHSNFERSSWQDIGLVSTHEVQKLLGFLKELLLSQALLLNLLLFLANLEAMVKQTINHHNQKHARLHKLVSNLVILVGDLIQTVHPQRG